MIAGTVAAVITSTVSLFLFGLTMLITTAFDNQLKLWTGGVEMIVYVKHGATDAQIQLIGDELRSQDTVVKSAEHCDEACATDVANTLFATDPAALEQLLPQIPSFFRVKPVDADNGEVLRSLRTEFLKLADEAVKKDKTDIDDIKSQVSKFMNSDAIQNIFAAERRSAFLALAREVAVLKIQEEIRNDFVTRKVAPLDKAEGLKTGFKVDGNGFGSLTVRNDTGRDLHHCVIASRLRIDYVRLAAAGLLVAGATGTAAWWFGKPFLTSAHAEPVIPVLGVLALASAALFDIGVYLAVVGTTMLALASLANASHNAEDR